MSQIKQKPRSFFRTHFTHRHPLNPTPINQIPPNTLCSGCRLKPTKVMYTCQTCKYILHESCINLPQKITHPHHEGCTLSLLTISGIFYCEKCHKSSEGWSYNCTSCDYDIHISCPSENQTYRTLQHNFSMPTAAKTSPPNPNKLLHIASTSSNEEMDHQSIVKQPPITHYTHLHPLYPTPRNQIPQNILCTGCKLQSSETMYACQPCNFILHNSCANLPKKITYHGHEGCTLSLLTVSRIFHCDECLYSGKGWSYLCTQCNYDLHVTCASEQQTKHKLQQSLSLPTAGATHSVVHKKMTQNENHDQFPSQISCNTENKPMMKRTTGGSSWGGNMFMDFMGGALQEAGQTLMQEALGNGSGYDTFSCYLS